MIVLRIAAELTLGLGLSAYGTAQVTPTVAGTASPPPAKEARICRAIVPTASVLAKRFCLTKTDGRRFNDTAQQNADDMLRHRATGMCDINCPR
jgi:hypothetical protein